MTGSSHHELSKWLASLLEPVLKRFSTHCIRDLFTFADAIQNSKDANNLFMCSFDISSLFTNVPLEETINICADALQNIVNEKNDLKETVDLPMQMNVLIVQKSFQ